MYTHSYTFPCVRIRQKRRINSCHYSDECDASILLSTCSTSHSIVYICGDLFDAVWWIRKIWNDLLRFIAITLISYHAPCIIWNIFELKLLAFGCGWGRSHRIASMQSIAIRYNRSSFTFMHITFEVWGFTGTKTASCRVHNSVCSRKIISDYRRRTPLCQPMSWISRQPLRRDVEHDCVVKRRRQSQYQFDVNEGER